MTFGEAQDAIYVDFECLATKPPHPALLGALVGSRDEHLEQIITDDRLAPAASGEQAVAGCDGVHRRP